VNRIATALATVAAVVILAACDTDELVPDVTNDDQDPRPPATDTRTSDPPSPSLPITTEP
jgi:uncharacterized lipoprotein